MRELIRLFLGIGLVLGFSVVPVLGQAPRPWLKYTVPAVPVGAYDDAVFLRDTLHMATVQGLYSGRPGGPYQRWDTTGLHPTSMHVGALTIDSLHRLWVAMGDTDRRTANSFFYRSGRQWILQDGPNGFTYGEPSVGLLTGPDGSIYRAAGKWGLPNLAWSRLSGGNWQETYSILSFNQGINRHVVDRRQRIWVLGTGPTYVGIGSPPSNFTPLRYDATIWDGSPDPFGSQDSLFLATNKGMAKMLGSSGRYTRTDSTNGLPIPSSRLRSIRFMADGTLLIGSEKQGLLVKRGARWWVFGDPYLPMQGGQVMTVKRIFQDERKQVHLLMPVGVVRVPPVIARIGPTVPPCPGQAWQPANYSLGLGDSALTYRWLFGDNSAEVAGRAPSHTYATAGTYRVRLIASNAGGARDTAFFNLNVGGGGSLRLTSDNSYLLAGDSAALYLRTDDPGLGGSYIWYRGSTALQTNPTRTPLLVKEPGSYHLVNIGASCTLYSDTVVIGSESPDYSGAGNWGLDGPLLWTSSGEGVALAPRPYDQQREGRINASTSVNNSEYPLNASNLALYAGGLRVRGFFPSNSDSTRFNKLGIPVNTGYTGPGNTRSMVFLTGSQGAVLYGVPGRESALVGPGGIRSLSFSQTVYAPGTSPDLRDSSAEALGAAHPPTSRFGTLAAIRHTNGVDFWLLTRHDSAGRVWIHRYLHRRQKDQVLYLGKQDVAVGVGVTTEPLPFHLFRASQDGRRIVLQSAGGIYIYSFDAISGTMTLLRQLPLYPGYPLQTSAPTFWAVASEVSPSRRYLYTLEVESLGNRALPNTGSLYRYDLNLNGTPLLQSRQRLSAPKFHDIAAWRPDGIVLTGRYGDAGDGLFRIRRPEDANPVLSDSLWLQDGCIPGVILPNLPGWKSDTLRPVQTPYISAKPNFERPVTVSFSYPLPLPNVTADSLYWDFGDGSAAPRQVRGVQVWHTYATPGTYAVSVKQGSQTILSLFYRAFGIQTLGPDLQLCQGQAHHLPYLDSVPAFYRGISGFAGTFRRTQTEPEQPYRVDSVATPGLYTFGAQVGCKAILLDAFTLTNRPPATLSILSDTLLLCPGDTVRLKARSSEGYSNLVWQNTRPSVSDSVYAATTAGTYTLQQQTTCGISNAQITLTERNDCIAPPAFLQNIVTPNGDGDNDTFRPDGWQGASLKVYTRYGRPVDVGYSANNGFDLADLPAGVYFFRMEPTAAQRKAVIKGWVEVVK